MKQNNSRHFGTFLGYKWSWSQRTMNRGSWFDMLVERQESMEDLLITHCLETHGDLVKERYMHLSVYLYVLSKKYKYTRTELSFIHPLSMVIDSSIWALSTMQNISRFTGWNIIYSCSLYLTRRSHISDMTLQKVLIRHYLIL